VTKVPSLSYRKIVNALQRVGFVVVRQRGSHIRLQKRAGENIVKLIVPAHKPVKKSTVAKIIKQAGLTVKEFLKLV
jgi:predicted RNA binding protein YcfA (HicA-like mRNA interferase family)